MIELSLDERKSISLNILDDFVAICEKHHFDYWLAYGTLLGAVRHKGFIPWDDDIDVWVPIEQYEKLLATLEIESKYTVISSLDENCVRPFSKLSDDSTCIIDLVPTRISAFQKRGVAIDIFPLFDTEDPKIVEKCMKYNAMAYRMFCYEKHVFEGSAKQKLKALYCWLHKIIGRDARYYKKKMHFIMQSCGENDMRGFPLSAYGMKDSFASKDFEKACATFEGRRFCIPAGYHNVLTALYGDYMTPPPPDKQNSNHHVKAYKLDEGDRI